VEPDTGAIEGVIKLDNSIGFASELVAGTLAPSWTLSPFILGSYRKQSTFRQAFVSIFAIHNETGNIMTHLVGFMIFVGLLIRDLFFRDLPPHHRMNHGAMMIAAMYRMGLSAV